MKFGKIPKKILKMVAGETYTDGEYTIRHELERLNEDILDAHWVFAENPKYLNLLYGWTKSYSFTLIDGPFGDKDLIYMERNPKHLK